MIKNHLTCRFPQPSGQLLLSPAQHFLIPILSLQAFDPSPPSCLFFHFHLKPSLVSNFLFFSLFLLHSQVDHMVNKSMLWDWFWSNQSHFSRMSNQSHARKCFSLHPLAASGLCSLSSNSTQALIIARRSQMPFGELPTILSGGSSTLWNNGQVYSQEFGVNARHNERNPVTNSNSIRRWAFYGNCYRTRWSIGWR